MLLKHQKLNKLKLNSIIYEHQILLRIATNISNVIGIAVKSILHRARKMTLRH